MTLIDSILFLSKA
jgi:hypothetical protein